MLCLPEQGKKILKHILHRRILVDVFLHTGLNHGWEEGDLSLERSAIGCGKGIEVGLHDGVPTLCCRCCQSFYVGLRDVLAVHHRTARATWKHRHHAEMALQPAEDALVGARLDVLGPVVGIVVVATESGHADADGVLCTADDAVRPLGIVLETEHQLGEHLGIHVGQMNRPDALDLIACRSGESAAFTNLERRFQRDRQRPSRSVSAHVGLVNPCASKVETGGDARPRMALPFYGGDAREGRGGLQLLFDCCTASRLQPIGRDAVEHDVFDAALLAEPALLLARAVGIHHESVGLQRLHRRDEVHHAVALVDEGVRHVADALHHEQTFLLRIERLVMLIMEDGRVRTDADIQVTILTRLPEEFHVTAVEQVVTTTDKDFHRMQLFFLMFLIVASRRSFGGLPQQFA